LERNCDGEVEQVISWRVNSPANIQVLIIIGGSYMASSILPALLMSVIAFLIPLAQIALFKALLRSGLKT
jgi:hypothetical protein